MILLITYRTEALSTEMAAYYPTGYFREDTLMNSKSELEFHPTDSLPAISPPLPKMAKGLPFKCHSYLPLLCILGSK